MAGEENFRHAPAAKFLGAGVLRAFEPGPLGAKGFGLRAGFVADDIGEQAHDGIDDDQRGERAVGENEIADAEFLVDEMFANALIDAFVMAADKNNAIERGEFARLGLVEFGTARGEENNAARLRCLGLHVLHGGKNRFALEQHAGAAAVGLVIDGVMLVRGVITQLVQADFRLTAALGAPEDRGVEGTAHDFREKGDDVDAHGRRGNFDGINGINGI